ncbi:MAG: CsbD family protein [Actinobacteria bacterium]|nr:CsbD family protein [Actinomycetota bacterium]
MGLADKAKNTVEKAVGEVKEAVGKHTDDRDLQAEGKKDQVKGDLKNAGEKVKDAFKN